MTAPRSGVGAFSRNGGINSVSSAAIIAAIPSILTSFSTCEILTGSGNWTVPAGITRVYAIVVGGGGGGGGIATGVAATATSGQAGCMNAGFLAVTPGGTVAYAVGALGTGAAAGANNGTAGGDTNFGAIIAKGGVGGAGSASGNAASPLTTAARLAQLAAMAVVPTTSICVSPWANPSIPLAGSAGVGGTGFPTINFGLPGAGGSSAAGGNATGYGQAGGGAGHTASLQTYAGGDGSVGTILLFY